MDHARRRPAGPTPATPEQAAAPDRFAAILDLQRTAGNAALTQLLSAAGPQRQATDTLTEPVTEPGEASEEESGSMMGDPSRVTDPHDHGVQPRHVQEFADLVAAARGGSWRIEPR